MIDMNETKLTTLEQVRMFLAGTAEIGFCVTGEGEDGRYRHIAGVLTRFGYKRLKKPDKGLILRYLERTTGYSRQQMTRLVNRWGNGKGLHKRGIRMSASMPACSDGDNWIEARATIWEGLSQGLC